MSQKTEAPDESRLGPLAERARTPGSQGKETAPSGPLPFEALLYLQKFAGNAAVAEMVESAVEEKRKDPAAAPDGTPAVGSAPTAPRGTAFDAVSGAALEIGELTAGMGLPFLGGATAPIAGAIGSMLGTIVAPATQAEGKTAAGESGAAAGNQASAASGQTAGAPAAEKAGAGEADASGSSDKGQAAATGAAAAAGAKAANAEPDAPAAGSAAAASAAGRSGGEAGGTAPAGEAQEQASSAAQGASAPASPAAAEAAGGFDPAAPPPIGETVPEIPEPPERPVPALGRVGHHPKAPEPPALGDLGAPPSPERPAFEPAVAGIGQAAAGASTGGLLDSIVQSGVELLGRMTGTVASTASSVAGEVGDRAVTASGEVNDTAKSETTAAVGQAQSAASTAVAQAAEHVGAGHTQAQHAVAHAVSQARAAPGLAAGQMESVVQKVLEGAPAVPTFLSPFASVFEGIFKSLPALMERALRGAESTVNGVLDRAVAAVNTGSQRLGQVMAAAAGVVERTIDWVAAKAASLRAAAQERLAGLPSMVRSALSAVVDRVLGAVSRAANTLAAMAKRLIDSAVANAQRWLQTIAGMIVTLITGLRSRIARLLAGLRSAIRAAIAEVNALRAWLVAKASAMIARAIRAIIGPLYQRAYDRLIQLIGPEIQAALERARLMFPNGLPAPPEVAMAAVQAGQQAAPGILQQIKQGLLNPEGDHFSIGFQLGGSFGAGGGGSAGGGASLEIVMDYRRNDIGFFVSPAGGAQANLGDVSETGHLSVVGGWGTVASFGDPNQDVIASYRGLFENVSGGVQGGVSPGFGGFIGTGDQLYRSGGGDIDALFSPEQAAVPGRPETRYLGEVRFRTQKSDAEAADGGPAAMNQAADSVKAIQAQQGSSITSLRTVGESSRIWERPRRGSTRERENRDLSKARADSVKAGLESRLAGSVPVQSEGAGDVRAEAMGRSRRDNSPEFRRASMLADLSVGAVPGQASHLDLGGFPARFSQERSAWGWDTTVTVGGLAGPAGRLGGYAGAGLSYSIPLGKTHLDAATMEMVRQGFYTMKLQLDLMSASPLGLLRDIVAHERVHVAPDATQMMSNQVTQWSVPMPSGIAAA